MLDGVTTRGGELDPNFGNFGKVTTNFNNNSGWDEARAVTMQGDKILVVGSTGAGDFGLVRYRDDGSLDTGFGTGGLVTTHFAAGAAAANAVAINNRMIVAAGTVEPGDVALARYDPATGQRLWSIADDLSGGWDAARAVAILPDDTIIVAGSSNNRFALAHYDSDGVRDENFSSAPGGVFVTEFGETYGDPNAGGEAYALAWKSVGTPRFPVYAILAAGGNHAWAYTSNFALARYFYYYGALIPDTPPTVTTNIAWGSWNEAHAMAVQADGSVVLAGLATNDFEAGYYGNFGLARFTSDGQLDRSFGDQSGWPPPGTVTTDFFDYSSDCANGVVVQADGRIIAAGWTEYYDQPARFALARYNPDGSLDTVTFGTEGKVTTDFSELGFQSAKAAGIVLDGHGNYVVAGTAYVETYSSFALARYTPGTAPIKLPHRTPVSVNVVGWQDWWQYYPLNLPGMATFTHAGSLTGETFTYRIDWGDGNVDSGTFPDLTGDPLIMGTIDGSHTYVETGMYYVAVTVTDSDGGSDTQTFLVTVNAASPPDTVPPGSSVSPLPAVETSTSFTVSWSGADNWGGRGLSLYDVYVSDNGGLFNFWAGGGWWQTSATFTGQNGHTYAFYSVATDYAGNREAPPDTADATTTVQTQVPTTTVVTTDHPAGSVYGQAVTFIATVSAAGAGTPTGAVQFLVDSAEFGGPVTLSGGTAGIVVTTLGAGTHQIDAIYTSDAPARFQDSQTTAPLTEVVTPAPLTITADDKTMLYGAAVPELTVAYSGYVNGESDLDVPPTVATAATFSSPVGSYAITASDASDPDYTITYVPGTLTIVEGDTMARVNSSVNPSVYGQPVTLTATVNAAAPGAAAPTGTVTFKDGSTVLATVALQGGSASFTSETLDRGLHTISVTYGGDGNFKSTASSPIIQSVQVVVMEPDPVDPRLFTLAVGGTAGNDWIGASYNRGGNQLEITIWGPSPFRGSYDASHVAHLALFGGRGNDILYVDASVLVPALLFGGDGDDWLQAGSGASVLLGGSGNDVLHGGKGHNLLIGGLGIDALWGHGGDDILIGGTTDYDADLKALDLVLAEWSRAKVDYATRMNHLLGPTPGGPAGSLNGAYFLCGATVHDDATIDFLNGGPGTDWFFGTSGLKGDWIFGRKPSEWITTL
jgi:uncharacterized delta-60 repeat protein